MNKAFIFDMDGVIVDSETVWQKYDKALFTSLLGEKGYQKISKLILGSTADGIYENAVAIGLKIEKNQFIQQYDELAVSVYKDAKITKNLDTLIEKLVKQNFRIGLLTASRPLWIKLVMEKVKNNQVFEYIISLEERKDLKPRPYPDGYNAMIKKLGSVPDKTIIIEDSQKGIDSAKASGALTICLMENLVGNTQPIGADYYMKNIKEVIKFIENYEK